MEAIGEGIHIAGYNLNSLSPKIRYAIGFGLLAAIGCFIMWFLKKLSTGDEKFAKTKQN